MTKEFSQTINDELEKYWKQGESLGKIIEQTRIGMVVAKEINLYISSPHEFAPFILGSLELIFATITNTFVGSEEYYLALQSYTTMVELKEYDIKAFLNKSAVDLIHEEVEDFD